MPKSKQQKQQEAAERKRKFFHVYQEMWQKAQVAVTNAPSNIGSNGKRFLQHEAHVAEVQLLRAAEEAHVDRHGNPLETVSKYSKPKIGIRV